MLTQAVAAVPILATKLYIPKTRSGLVSRPRLLERLDLGTDRKLTLISAPAGFGKTTLLAEWLATSTTGERSAAWVSLDQSDNDPAFFWTYVITALQRACPELDARAALAMQSPRPPPIASVLTTLINDLDAFGRDVALVLDDFHVIEAPPIHEAVAFLLDHLPPRMHLVIASRSDPPLPLARLRGRRESTELRASDLRFTPAEAAVFLKQVMGLDLSGREVESLETRTEGWIAGLQLAALSMRGRDDVAGFIRSFAGDDRYIVDYLVDEVLRRQPEETRAFLLQTSMLN
jgi:LuxR family maltose regulon positive regulatory protein